MASDEMRAAVELLRQDETFKGATVDVATLRAGMAANVQPVDTDIMSRDLTIVERPARHVEAPGARQDCGILYFHGGGYVLGSLDTHHELMGRLSRTCQAPVLGLDYRLAPEHPYPAAVEDAVNAYLALRERGISADRIVLGGDSAGGGLALACLLALKTRGKALPAGAVLFSPWTDLSGSGESTNSRADVDPMVSPQLLQPMAALYRGDVAAEDPGVSPLFGDLEGLPPMLIQVGDHEILLDDSTRLASTAQAAGVEVDLEIYDGAFHVFQVMPELPESADALTKVGMFFERCINAR
jgi:acetyl esterase/lipase